MIDFHTHTIFSDGELIPSELVRRAVVKGYEAIALTDHVDSSNIDFVLPRIVKVSNELNKYWKIKVLPGIEISHVPLEEMGKLVKYARKNGAKIVVVHGETTMEPVLPGTNRRAIECGADILAHPGRLSKEDASFAAAKGVYLEITTRKNHSGTNKEVIAAAKEAGAKLILDTDSHGDDDLVDDRTAADFLKGLGLSEGDIKTIFDNSRELLRKKIR